MPDLIDLSKLAGLTVRQESDAELAARLVREELELKHKLHTQIVAFYTMGVLYVLTFVGACFISITTSSEELRKWAMSIVTLFAGALVGFLTGKQMR